MLDCGASQSVCSLRVLEQWQDRLLLGFPDDAAVWDSSQSKEFKFGSGHVLQSVAKISFPACVGMQAGAIGIHGLDHDSVPPLLGIDAMKGLQLNVDFGEGKVFHTEADGSTTEVERMEMPSGHYAIDLLGQMSHTQREQALTALATVRSRISPTSATSSSEAAR